MSNVYINYSDMRINTVEIPSNNSQTYIVLMTFSVSQCSSLRSCFVFLNDRFKCSSLIEYPSVVLGIHLCLRYEEVSAAD